MPIMRASVLPWVLLALPARALALESVPGQGGMLDINVTLFIQMVNYLVFIFLMDRILFQPMLAHLDAQSGRIDGADAAAREAQVETEKVEAERREKLAAVYLAESGERARARARALEEYQRVVASARSEDDRELQVARESARLEAERLERELSGQVDELGALMAEAVLRTGGARKASP